MKKLIPLFLLWSSLAFAQQLPMNGGGYVANSSVPTSGPGSGTVTSVGGTTNQIVCTNPTTAAICGISGLASIIGPVSVTGTSGTGSDFFNAVCINKICPVTGFGAVAEATTPALTLTTTVASSATVQLAGPGNYANLGGISIYGAGTTYAGAGTGPTPTVTWNGFIGSTEYDYKIVSCDANYGCSIPSAAGTTTTGVAVLSQPNEGGTTGQYPGLTWTSDGSAHYLICRQKASGGYVLWASSDTNSFNDWSNHTGMGLTGPYNSNVCTAVASTNDVYTGQITTGGGTNTLTVTPAVPNSITLTNSWPDDVAAFNAAYTAAATIGGSVQVPAGFYKIRTVTPKAGVVLQGASPLGNAKGSQIVGTPGYDMFVAGAISSNQWKNLYLRDGRSVFNPTGIWTYIKTDNLTTNPNYATWELSQNIEELYVTDTVMSGGWYAIEQNGANYIEKASFDRDTFNGQLVNSIRINTNTLLFSGVTFKRALFQCSGQDDIYINAPTTNITFDGLSEEGIGSDFTRAITTGTTVATSNIVTVASNTGLAVGDWLTQVGGGGAAASGDILQGYICNIAGTAITIDSDAACTTPANAATTQSTGQYVTNSPYDNVYWGGGGSGVSAVKFDNPVFATAGGGCGSAQTRFQVNNANGAFTYINANGKIYNPTGNAQIVNGASVTLYRDTIAGIGFTPSSFTNPMAGGPASQLFTMLTSPPGADINLGLVDSTSNGSGTVGSLRLRQYDGNQTSLFSYTGNRAAKDASIMSYRGQLDSVGTTFANLATDLTANGGQMYCSDCTNTPICAGSGTGALAIRLNGVNTCNGGQNLAKGTVFAAGTISVTGPTTVGCTDTTTAVTSATTTMTVLVSPQTNPNGSTFGFSWSGYVSSAGNIAVRVCNTVIDTAPPATTYNYVVLN